MNEAKFFGMYEYMFQKGAYSMWTVDIFTLYKFVVYFLIVEDTTFIYFEKLSMSGSFF
jgi:hypothetical protein